MTAKTLLIPLLLAMPLGAAAQAEDSLSKVAASYSSGQWQEVVRETEGLTSRSAQLDYYRGMAFAKLQRWNEASRSFESGRRKSPRDKRFPIELAGVAFRQGRNRHAESLLRRALKLDSTDAYAADFLATIYLLDGNIEAALKYWNRTGKPRVEEIKIDPPLRVDPELLDRAFAAAPASVLTLDDYRTTRARLDALGIFADYRLDLVPRPAPDSDGDDLELAADERNGWGNSRWQGLASLAGGLPYQTVYPQFYNLRRSAMNLESLVRWDSNKRRAFVSVSAPLGDRPGWSYRLYADGRDEAWDVTNPSFGAAGLPFTLHKIQAGGEVTSVVNSRVIWQGGIAVSDRTFSGIAAGSAARNEFTNGFAMEARSRAQVALLRLPEKRFTLDSSLTGRLGRAYAQPLGQYGALESSFEARWFPEARGDDYEIEESFGGGRIFGQVPFDELYMLGLERDNDLPLRAHIGTQDGMKGSAPLARGYLLSNWEINKNVFNAGWFRLRVAPFLDAGRAYDSTFGSRQWLWDTGGEVKFGVLGGMTVVLTFGKDLRTGRNTFYATVERRTPQGFSGLAASGPALP